jgi:hypothetical protein
MSGRTVRHGPGHGNVAFGRVGADHVGAEPRHRFGQQAAAAADVEKAQAREGARGQIAAELRRDLLVM